MYVIGKTFLNKLHIWIRLMPTRSMGDNKRNQHLTENTLFLLINIAFNCKYWENKYCFPSWWLFKALWKMVLPRRTNWYRHSNIWESHSIHLDHGWKHRSMYPLQAKKAWFDFRNITNKFGRLPPDVMCKISDSKIAPILLYGCEMWGTCESMLMERVHLRFCRYLLSVPKTTTS